MAGAGVGGRGEGARAARAACGRAAGIAVRARARAARLAWPPASYTRCTPQELTAHRLCHQDAGARFDTTILSLCIFVVRLQTARESKHNSQ